MAASIVLVKVMTYRGANEEYSNRYHFDGGAPDTDAKWLALDNAIRAEEKKIFNPNTSTIIRTLGYEDDDSPAVYARSFVTASTGAFTGDRVPGDSAVWIRYTTARRDSRGHPVYLRNFYHGILATPGAQSDAFLPAQAAAFSTYGAAWVAGFSDGTVTHKRTGPDSLGATGHSVSQWIARRKLKRRG